MNKGFAGILSAATVALGVLGAATGAQAQQVVLKVSHFWPPSAMGPSKVMEPWCAKIAKESNNEMVCQLYPALQLGGTPAQLIDQAVHGVADIVWTLPGYTAGRFPSTEVFELPFMTHRAEPASRAVWEYCQKYCAKEFKGIKPLAFNVHDEGFIHNNKRPITQLSDFSGLKMRAPTRMTNKLLAAFGATPVAMPLPAVPEAVSKGVVDGYLLPWEVVPTMKLDELTKYHSETPTDSNALYTAVFIIGMNQAKYDSLPPKLKKIIDDNTGADFSASIGKAWDNSAVEARDKVLASKPQMNTIPKDELAKWQPVSDKVIDAWVEEMNGKGLDGKAMLTDARALIAKATAAAK